MSRLRYATQSLNAMNEELPQDLQWLRLRQQNHYCLAMSEFYRRRCAELGIDARDIRSMEAF